VVDSALTATRCIQYLREQRLRAECFLPIDSLAVKAVREEFRTLAEKGYPKVRLAFDVLRCPDAEVKKAAQFVCSNALICDTVEEARFFAYQYDARLASTPGAAACYNKTITIDGTYLSVLAVDFFVKTFLTSATIT
jgi:structural maintenance of chromosome 1